MSMPIMKDGAFAGFRRITGSSSKHPGKELDAFISAQNKQFVGRQASSLSKQERSQIINGIFGIGVTGGTGSSGAAPAPQQKSLGTTGGLTSNQANTTKKRRSILAGGVSGGGATVLGRSM